VIRSVVIVPSAPMLLPEYVGRQDVAAGLRAAATAAVRAGYGAPDGGGVGLLFASDREPRSLRPALGGRVGRMLMHLALGSEAGSVTDVQIPWDADVSTCVALGERLAADPRVGTLVVVADGSACRTEKAPGHFDERAAGFDGSLVEALRSADPRALVGIDAGLAAVLLAHGRAPLQVAAAAMGADRHWRCDSLEQSDPFGVLYVVARLSPTDEPEVLATDPLW
jgi:hypothetical protein